MKGGDEKTYNQMIQAAEYIDTLEEAIKTLRYNIKANKEG